MTSRTKRRPRYPLRVDDAIWEAGASAYAWYEEHLCGVLDPMGTKRRWSDRIEAAVFFGAILAAAVATAAAGHGIAAVILAVAYLAASAIFGHLWTAPHWGLTFVLTTVTLLVAMPSPWEQTLVVVACMAAALWWLTLRAVRPWVFVTLHAATAVAALLTTALPHGAALAITVIVGAASAYAAAWVLQGKRLMSPAPARLRREQFSWSPPAPPSGMPWLLRAQVRQFERRGAKERSSRVRSQEEAAIDIKKAGGDGERATALRLLGLHRFRGTRVLHDVLIPGATEGGNIDHIVVARTGVWVVDSKRFGAAKDPGEVRRGDDGEFVHVTSAGVRSMDTTVRTLAWAIRGVREELDVPVRGVFVVHGAEVAPGLSVTVPGRSAAEAAVVIDVVSVRHVVGHLEAGPAVLSRRQISGSLWGFQAKLTSATTGRAPMLVRPLGGAPADKAPGVFLDGPASSAPAAVAPGERDSDLGGGVVPADVVQPLVYPGEGPAEMSARMVQTRWEQIGEADPAAADDVPEDLREVARGSRLYLLEVLENDVRSWPLVALSRPCQGGSGVFVWACSPEQWEIHQSTGRPVMASTISTNNLALRAGV